jgi:hypothetical protein
MVEREREKKNGERYAQRMDASTTTNSADFITVLLASSVHTDTSHVAIAQWRR